MTQQEETPRRRTTDPRHAYLVGGGLLLVFVLVLVVGLADGQWPWYQVVLAILTALLGAYYLGLGRAAATAQ